MGMQYERRRLLHASLALLAMGAIAPAGRARAGPAYAETIAAMKEAHRTESHVSQRYAAFSRKALEDGYKGVAYLFIAFGASEAIHAANFARALAQLGVAVPGLPRWSGQVGTTRENLIAAARSEAESIDDMYPAMLERIRPEGHRDAMRYVQFAWASERQHADRIRQIRRYSPTMFELVAKHIDSKTGSYYVCQGCGSTLNAMPASTCPVCQVAAKSYARVEPPS